MLKVNGLFFLSECELWLICASVNWDEFMSVWTVMKLCLNVTALYLNVKSNFLRIVIDRFMSDCELWQFYAQVWIVTVLCPGVNCDSFMSRCELWQLYTQVWTVTALCPGVNCDSFMSRCKLWQLYIQV